VAPLYEQWFGFRYRPAVIDRRDIVPVEGIDAVALFAAEKRAMLVVVGTDQ